MKVEIQKRVTFVEYSESRIGNTWSTGDHMKLLRHLRAVDELAQAAYQAKATEVLRPITEADFAAIGRGKA